MQNTTGFERPVHRWVRGAIAAVQSAPATLGTLVETPSPSAELSFGLNSPSVWILGHGWWTPEPWGTWTHAELAELKLPSHTFRRCHGDRPSICSNRPGPGRSVDRQRGSGRTDLRRDRHLLRRSRTRQRRRTSTNLANSHPRCRFTARSRRQRRQSAPGIRTLYDRARAVTPSPSDRQSEPNAIRRTQHADNARPRSSTPSAACRPTTSHPLR